MEITNGWHLIGLQALASYLLTLVGQETNCPSFSSSSARLPGIKTVVSPVELWWSLLKGRNINCKGVQLRVSCDVFLSIKVEQILEKV
jgi:hypothetical protein